MSDTRRQDPLRRTPPTIDLKAEIVPSKGDKPGAEPSGAASDGGASAIEPVASTALDAVSAAKGTPPAKGAPAPKDAPSSKADPAPKSAAAAKTPETRVESAPKPAEPAKTEPAKPSDAGAKPAATASAAASGPASPSVSAKPVESAKPAEPAKPGDATKPADAALPKAGDTKPTGSPSSPGSVSGPTAKPGETAAAKPNADSAQPVVSSASGAAVAGAKPMDPALPKAAEPASKPAEPKSDAAASERAKATGTPGVSPSSAPPPGRVGAGTILTAGFVGGLLGALLAFGLMQILPRDGAAEDRLAILERQFAALPKGPGALEPRVVALESGVKQASDEAKAAARQAAEALGRPTGIQGPDQEARTGVRALATRVDESAARTATTVAALGDLGQKLDALGRATSDRFTSVAKDAETFATHQKSLQADVALLRTGTSALEGRSVEADKRLAALTDGLGRVSSDLARVSPAALQAGLRIIVSGRLDDALRSGAPLGAPLAALGKLGTDAATLAPLKPYADNAAPSAAALLGEFKPLGVAMTTEPAKPDEGWLDKGRRVLGKVVTVQTVGDGSGQDVPSLVARVESSLGRGNVTEAKTAFDRLPEDKRRMASAWGDKLGARVAAEEAVRRVGTQSLAALDAATR